jgi:hypothetical protein
LLVRDWIAHGISLPAEAGAGRMPQPGIALDHLLPFTS